MASLVFLPASFAQAVGSATPAFAALLAYLIQGRLESGLTYAALLPIAVGVMLSSGGEPLFNATGTALQLLACAARALRSVLAAALLTDKSEKFHPLTLLAWSSLFAALQLLPVAALTESEALALAVKLHATHASFAPLVALSCALAFLVNLSNLLISKQLGALTLQVLGNLKNVSAVSAA
ncbi:hypothetical protein GPECTOR_1g619 [Gonium pectorale]|uniref:Sugar phosphate transporter domain-containing protein n=1 Tax=Gonium pectorale TaxID=33097 RepID=A0A150H3E0_GONPE|nr:hypothetical protein GPECTOR_1g619 [Gonium pectorale]|eukprot:KXZ56687.1 hypothetical protein GPECTOR_1g619 [Gonium pectorale]